MSQPHLYRLKILERHLDTFGHVNNAVYLQLFEEARWDMVTAGGYGRETVLETGLGPVILEVNLKFRRELLLRESITIETVCAAYRKKLGAINQRIINERGEDAAVAHFTFGLFDMRARKLVYPTPQWLAAIGQSREEAESEKFAID